MANGLLIFAGLGGIAIALFHGYVSHTKILSRITELPPTLQRINYAVYQMSTLYWIVGGVLLCLAPFAFDPPLRGFIAVVVAMLYGSGAAANLWATRGRHFGWPMLAVVAACAYLGG